MSNDASTSRELGNGHDGEKSDIVFVSSVWQSHRTGLLSALLPNDENPVESPPSDLHFIPEPSPTGLSYTFDSVSKDPLQCTVQEPYNLALSAYDYFCSNPWPMDREGRFSQPGVSPSYEAINDMSTGSPYLPLQKTGATYSVGSQGVPNVFLSQDEEDILATLAGDAAACAEAHDPISNVSTSSMISVKRMADSDGFIQPAKRVKIETSEVDTIQYFAPSAPLQFVNESVDDPEPQSDRSGGSRQRRRKSNTPGAILNRVRRSKKAEIKEEIEKMLPPEFQGGSKLERLIHYRDYLRFITERLSSVPRSATETT
ncbi:hypothetical protein FA95DRAFT_645803 [Auriscalpium vulgare]|uniref:Uncharacterized protein n=1 Tax=Auriscalpium vulgare TaxID=40419 RepID=A0ACB8S1R4_9AGAM|nr:hypothetical protein FA95DRAFT_645803 [Auriscalpium vulgare]